MAWVSPWSYYCLSPCILCRSYPLPLSTVGPRAAPQLIQTGLVQCHCCSHACGPMQSIAIIITILVIIDDYNMTLYKAGGRGMYVLGGGGGSFLV